ncbi:KAT8 regulatory NSL complex subunit 1-like protein isoform X1 [Lethenteron reissneri]|uniref:KAT8 regulatory NSL complex subunit 1-like protein isoform X1 n=1 Tax=Lethenteron reissneri TaxID=7753 RepID=UPI002AB7681B|nr:KAT8 regulatory NSL complex subunit 1-like protein isoform X1 [Lethenteron reissneri]
MAASSSSSPPRAAVLQSSVQRLVALEQRARRLAQRLRLAQAEATESHARQQLRDLLAEQQQQPPSSPPPPPPLPPPPVQQQLQLQLQQQRPPRAVDAAAAMAPRGVAGELGRVPRSLAAALRHVERALDSDATESSSGGDTDTEEVDNDESDVCCDDDHHHQGSRSGGGGGGGAWVGDLGVGAWMGRAHHHQHHHQHHHDQQQQQQQQQPEQPRSALRRSTAWLWARERAMVASRWTWLTAQVSDLEYRIRQHNELYRQIRIGKGPVVLGDLQAPEDVTRPHRRLPGTGAAPALPLAGETGGGRVEMSACSPALLLSNLHKQSSRLKQSLGGMACPLSPASSPQPKPSPPQLNGVLAGSSSCTRGGDAPPDGFDAAKRRPAAVSRGAPAPPSPPGSSSCVAARTRPLRELRRRRVLRASDAYFLSRKAQRPVTVRCSCEQPLSCMVCVSPYTTQQQQQQPMNLDTMTLPERAAVLSPSTHPVLSLPNDIPLHLHFQSLMKRAEWHERMNPKPKVPASSSSNNNKRPTGVPRAWTASPGSPAERKQRHKPDASLLTTKCDWSKACVDPSLWQYLDSVERGPSPLDSLDTDGEDGGHFKKRRRSGHSPLAGSKRQRGGVRSRSLTLGESPEGTAAVVTAPPLRQAYTPVPADASPAPPTLPLASAYAHTSAAAATPTSTQASARRRRVENSFDINNIVIPLSMAAFAHVEKIQYKEILTPGWRELGFENEGPDIEEVEEVEDVSDESFADRHARFEQMEKTRWCFWSPAIHRRTRSFNKSTSEGRCTPQPPSPDVSVSGGGSNHHTGLNAEQHRSADRSLRDSFCESTRSSTPDMCSEEVFLVVQPWEKRAFPLREQEEIALAESDCNHRDERRSASPAPTQQFDRHPPPPPTGNSEEPSAAAPPPCVTERDGAAPPPREERRPAKRSLRSASARQPHDPSEPLHDGKAREPRSRSAAGSLGPTSGDDNNYHTPSGRTRAGDGKSRNSIVLRAGRRTNSH